jgi:hypothetical protein
VASFLDHKEVIVMRRSSFAALSAFCFAMVSGLWLAAAAAETPDAQEAATEAARAKSQADVATAETKTPVEEKDASQQPLADELLGIDIAVRPSVPGVVAEPEATTQIDFDFPLYSSRRTWGWNRFAGQSSTEPALFEAEDPQPLFRLPDENETIQMPPSYPMGNITLSGNGIEYSRPIPIQPNFQIDNWGIHPATPVPTPVPDGDVLIDARVVPAGAEEAQDDASEQKTSTELKQGEAAKVILELMDTLGRSVLDGTVFEKPSEVDAQWLKDLGDSQATPREALIQYIRALESQQEQARQQAAHEADEHAAEEVIPVSAEEIDLGEPQKATEEVGEIDAHLVDDQHDEVESLRGSSEELEQLANRLERRENYLRADQVRELAGQLRLDARRIQSPEMAEMMPPAMPMPVNDPFSMGGIFPPPQYPFLAAPGACPSPLPSYGPVMPHRAPHAVAPTPQPTFEASPNVKQLETEVRALRDELRKARRLLGNPTGSVR